MLTGLDHIIIGVNDLEQASTILSERLGLALSGGGIHPSGGTANRIIVIGDTYLEQAAMWLQPPAVSTPSSPARPAAPMPSSAP